MSEEEKIVRPPELQARMEMLITLQTLDLLVAVWPTNFKDTDVERCRAENDQEVWLSAANALWQAAGVTRDLDVIEAPEMLEDMARLAEIRAKMEAVT